MAPSLVYMPSVPYPDRVSPIAIGFLTSAALWAVILPIHLLLSVRRGRPVEWTRVRTHFLYHFTIVGFFASPSWILAWTMAGVAALGGSEFMRLCEGPMEGEPHRSLKIIFCLGSALLPLTLYFLPSYSSLYLLMIFSVLCGVIILRQWTNGSLLFLGVFALYIVLLTLYFSLISLHADRDGFAWCYFVFVTATLTDDFAYSLGPHVGSRLLVPAVSPNKKVAVLLLCYPLTGLWSLLFRIIFSVDWSVPKILGITWAVTAGAQLGDLTFSLLKRNRGLKDFGECLPGVGGIWDAMDSLVFSFAVLALFDDFKVQKLENLKVLEPFVPM